MNANFPLSTFITTFLLSTLVGYTVITALVLSTFVVYAYCFFPIKCFCSLHIYIICINIISISISSKLQSTGCNVS